MNPMAKEKPAAPSGTTGDSRHTKYNTERTGR